MTTREAETEAPDDVGGVVLVVDDEPDVASVTAAHLERHLEDVAVVTETGGQAAIERFSADVDCVVSDYEMPAVDGLELLNRLRDRDPDLPFILFTARGSEEIASEAISAGVTDYLQKGVGTDQYAVLANRIENAIDRRRSQAAAAETRSRYRQLVEHSPNAIVVHDGDAIQYANEQAATLYGVDRTEDLLGEMSLSWVHPDDRSFVAERIARIVDDREMTDWAGFRIRPEDGSVRHVEARGAPVHYDGVAACQAVLRDVTDRRRHDRRIRALHDATRRLVTAESVSEAADVAISTVEDVFEEPIACLWIYDAARGELVPLSATEHAIRVARESGFEPGEDTLPDWTVEMSVFEAGEQRIVEDFAERDDVVTDALEAVLMHPLDGHGLLTISTTDPERTFDESDRDLVGILGRAVTAALDRVGVDTGND